MITMKNGCDEKYSADEHLITTNNPLLTMGSSPPAEKPHRKNGGGGDDDIAGDDGVDALEMAPFEFNYCRYWILLISICTMTLLSGNSVAFNFTIICMTQSNDLSSHRGNIATLPGANTTHNESFSLPYWREDSYYYYDYSTFEKNLLFTGSALGSLISSPPITLFITKFGLKKTFLTCGWISVLATLLLPAAARAGLVTLFGARIAQAIGMTPLLSAIGHISREWSPPSAAGTYILLLSTPYQLGAIMAMPVSSAFCTSKFGWPSVYYIHGIVTAVLLVLFNLFFWERPDSDGCWSGRNERLLLNRGSHRSSVRKENPSKSRRKKSKQVVPYARILSDPVVWILTAGLVADALGTTTLYQYGPIYLNSALGMSLNSTGWAAALLHMVALVTKLVVGPVNDRMVFMSDRARTKMWSVISAGGSVLCFIMLALPPHLNTMGLWSLEDPPMWLPQAFFTLVNVFSGLVFLGLIKSCLLISQQFSHVLMTWIVVIHSATSLILPAIVSLIAPNYSISEWSIFFAGLACFQLAAAVAYVAKCDLKPREWTSGMARGETGKANGQPEKLSEREKWENEDEEDGSLDACERASIVSCR